VINFHYIFGCGSTALRKSASNIPLCHVKQKQAWITFVENFFAKNHEKTRKKREKLQINAKNRSFPLIFDAF